jgi:hypothetical protein
MHKNSKNTDHQNDPLINPDPPKPNNKLVVFSGVCMVGWMVFLLYVAIIANR